ncbi:MAG: hypothetical protein ACRBN8_19595 [Nannocystales bacterium]
MKIRSIPLLGLTLMPFLAFVSPACDEESDCPAGHEGCLCTEEFSCLEGLECLSEYCVSPSASGGDSNDGGTDADGDGDGDGGSSNNVQACEAFVDSLDCGLPQGALDCSSYAGLNCDLTDYLDCLADNSTCTNGMLDATGWVDCVSLSESCV